MQRKVICSQILNSSLQRCTIYVAPLSWQIMFTYEESQTKKKFSMFGEYQFSFFRNVPLANGDDVHVNQGTIRCLFRWFLWYQCLSLLNWQDSTDSSFSPWCIETYHSMHSSYTLGNWNLCLWGTIPMKSPSYNENRWPERLVRRSRRRCNLFHIFWIVSGWLLWIVFRLTQFAEFTFTKQTKKVLYWLVSLEQPLCRANEKYHGLSAWQPEIQ